MTAPTVHDSYPTRVDAGMVFVCGFPSGGTDLVMSVMNAHPQVFLPGEFPLLPALADQYGAAVDAARFDELIIAMRKLDGYHNFVNHHWRNFAANRRDPIELPDPPSTTNGQISTTAAYQWLLGVPASAAWTGNKTPDNLQNVARLVRLFPNARFVVIARDVRDIVVSAKRKWGKDELLTAHKWDARMLLGLEQLRDLEPERGVVFKFEELLRDLEATSRRLCEFLGLEWSVNMLSFHEHTTKHIDGKPNWGKPLASENTGKWRSQLRPSSVRRVEEIAFAGMQALGYPPSVAERPAPLTRTERMRGRARDVISTLVVGNRYQQRRRLRSRLNNIVFQVRKRRALG